MSIIAQPKSARCRTRRRTLILDSSMVEPSEAMVTTRLTTKVTLMAALMAGGMTGVKAEVPFRRDSGADVVMLPSEGRKKNTEMHVETLHLLL